jgi:Ca2+-binding RTX toxin-like protein
MYSYGHIASKNTLYGTWKADYFDVDAGAQTVYGRGGEDTIFASGGSDRVYGGAGNDFISYAGTDANSNTNTDVVLSGGKGHDYVSIDLEHGFEGNARLLGGSGGDELVLRVGDNSDWHFDVIGGVRALINDVTDQYVTYDKFEFVWLV